MEIINLIFWSIGILFFVGYVWVDKVAGEKILAQHMNDVQDEKTDKDTVEENINDYASFSDAIDSIGATESTLLIYNQQNVTDDKTVPLNVALKFLHGGSLNVSAAKTVTINGHVEAGLYQIFEGDGSVAFGVSSVKEVYPQWWGENTTPGTTDMTAEIQAANDSLPNEGGVVFLSNGTYLVSDPIYLKSHTKLNGNGLSKTTITLADDSDCQVILAGSASATPYTTASPGENIAISNLTIDGNAANQSATGGRDNAGILLEYVDGVFINNIKIDDTGQNACAIYSCNHATVTNSRFSGVTGKAVGGEDKNGLTIVNNDIVTPASFPVVFAHRVDGCLFIDNAGFGFSMWGGRGCVVNNCVSDRNQAGIVMEDGNDANYAAYDNIISNCIDKDSDGSASPSFQIPPQATRCKIVNCISTNASATGILIQGDDSIISGCTIRDWGRGTGTDAYGITLTAADKTNVIGNQFIYETENTNFDARPIFLTGSNDFRIEGNLIHGSEDEAGINVTNSSRGIIIGNEIYGVDTYGIHLLGGGTWGDIIISGNLVHSNGDHGLWIQNACDNITISGNQFIDNGGWGLTISAVAIGNLCMIGNIGVNNTSGELQDGSTGSPKINTPNLPRNPDLLEGFAWNPGNLLDGAGETSGNIAVTGAAVIDRVQVFPPYSLQAILCMGYVSAANVVNIRLQNETGGAIDLANGTWVVKVQKYI